PEPLLGTRTVVLGDEDVMRPRVDLYLEDLAGATQEVDVTGHVHGDIIPVIVEPCADLTGPLLGAGGIVFGEKRVETAQRNVAIQRFSRRAGNIDATDRVRGDAQDAVFVIGAQRLQP